MIVLWGAKISSEIRRQTTLAINGVPKGGMGESGPHSSKNMILDICPKMFSRRAFPASGRILTVHELIDFLSSQKSSIELS